MRWDYCINRYIHSYCLVRGLTKESINTYQINLLNFKKFMIKEKKKNDPKLVKIMDVFDYLEHLKVKRGNGQASISKNAGIIRNFYRGLVSLGYLDYYENPVRDLKKMKAPPVKMRDIISRKEAKRLLKATSEKTVIGVRDRAIMLLLYTTGIRASELCSLKRKDVDLNDYTIKVMGNHR